MVTEIIAEAETVTEATVIEIIMAVAEATVIEIIMVAAETTVIEIIMAAAEAMVMAAISQEIMDTTALIRMMMRIDQLDSLDQLSLRNPKNNSQISLRRLRE